MFEVRELLMHWKLWKRNIQSVSLHRLTTYFGYA